MSEIFSRYINGQRSVQAFGIVLIGIGLFLSISFASNSSLDYPNSSLPADSDFNWGDASVHTHHALPCWPWAWRRAYGPF